MGGCQLQCSCWDIMLFTAKINSTNYKRIGTEKSTDVCKRFFGYRYTYIVISIDVPERFSIYLTSKGKVRIVRSSYHIYELGESEPKLDSEGFWEVVHRPGYYWYCGLVLLVLWALWALWVGIVFIVGIVGILCWHSGSRRSLSLLESLAAWFGFV